MTSGQPLPDGRSVRWVGAAVAVSVVAVGVAIIAETLLLMERPDRHRLYFVLMGTCIGLILLAWFVVRFYSTPAAIAMSVVAAVIPPIAAMIGNRS